MLYGEWNVKAASKNLLNLISPPLNSTRDM